MWVSWTRNEQAHIRDGRTSIPRVAHVTDRGDGKADGGGRVHGLDVAERGVQGVDNGRDT